MSAFSPCEDLYHLIPTDRGTTCPTCHGTHTVTPAPVFPLADPRAVEPPSPCTPEPFRATEDVIRGEVDLDAVVRYYVQGYELGDAEITNVRYAVTSGHPRRVVLEITIKPEQAE